MILWVGLVEVREVDAETLVARVLGDHHWIGDPLRVDDLADNPYFLHLLDFMTMKLWFSGA